VPVIHDADSHVMETPDWFMDFADPGVREKLKPLFVATVKPGEADLIEEMRRRHADPEFRARDAQEIWTRKNWKATGSFLAEDRGRALDLLGFASQLVFNTFANKTLKKAEDGGDLEYAYGLARAHNRAMVDFCSADRRLLAVGYVPLADFPRAAAMAEEALAMGCAALMVASACPAGHSPSHVGLDPVQDVLALTGAPHVVVARAGWVWHVLRPEQRPEAHVAHALAHPIRQLLRLLLGLRLAGPLVGHIEAA